jgi:hypothetical protein
MDPSNSYPGTTQALAVNGGAELKNSLRVFERPLTLQAVSSANGN